MKQKRPYCLTKRELEISSFIVAGLYNSEIAKNLNITTNTVKRHVASILKKLGSSNKIQAAIKIVKENLAD